MINADRGRPIPEKTRDEVIARAKGYCEARLSGCRIRGEQIHHRRLRSRGGSNDPINLMVVCSHCHQQITDNKPGTEKFRTHSYQTEGLSENGEAVGC